jgi:hypothetical protein
MSTPDLKLTATIEALLGRLRRDDIEALPPARRLRLGALLRRWADRCEPQSRVQMGGGAQADYRRDRPPRIDQIEVEDFPDS